MNYIHSLFAGILFFFGSLFGGHAPVEPVPQETPVDRPAVSQETPNPVSQRKQQYESIPVEAQKQVVVTRYATTTVYVPKVIEKVIEKQIHPQVTVINQPVPQIVGAVTQQTMPDQIEFQLFIGSLTETNVNIVTNQPVKDITGVKVVSYEEINGDTNYRNTRDRAWTYRVTLQNVENGVAFEITVTDTNNSSITRTLTK